MSNPGLSNLLRSLSSKQKLSEKFASCIPQSPNSSCTSYLNVSGNNWKDGLYTTKDLKKNKEKRISFIGFKQKKHRSFIREAMKVNKEVSNPENKKVLDAQMIYWEQKRKKKGTLIYQRNIGLMATLKVPSKQSRLAPARYLDKRFTNSFYLPNKQQFGKKKRSETSCELLHKFADIAESEENTIKRSASLGSRFVRDKISRKPQKRENISKALNKYMGSQKKMIINKLKEIRDFEIKLRDKQQVSTKLGFLRVDNKVICEKDRIRLKDFLTNKWIAQLQQRNISGVTNDTQKRADTIARTELQIERDIEELKLVYDIYKDIRYSYYKYFDHGSNLKYSKNCEISKIFKKIYPDIFPENISTHMMIDMRKIKDQDKISLEREKFSIVNAKDRDYLTISNNMSKMMSEVDQIGTADYFLTKQILHKIKALIELDAINGIELPKTAKWRAAVSRMINFSELCQVELPDIISFNLLNKKFVQSYDILYLFDLLKTGDIEKLESVMNMNQMLKFEVDIEGKTLLHIAAIKCKPNVVQKLLKFKFDVNRKDNV